MTRQADPATIHTYNTEAPMLNYGDDGHVNEVDCDDVEQTINEILEYVEGRFEVLDSEDRQQDILALAQEFWEWGSADSGDEIGYLFLPLLSEK